MAAGNDSKPQCLACTLLSVTAVLARASFFPVKLLSHLVVFDFFLFPSVLLYEMVTCLSCVLGFLLPVSSGVLFL